MRDAHGLQTLSSALEFLFNQEDRKHRGKSVWYQIKGTLHENQNSMGYDYISLRVFTDLKREVLK